MNVIKKIYKKLRDINNKIGEVEKKGYDGLFDLCDDLQNEDNKLHCEKCGNLLPVFLMLVKAKSVKVGETYTIKCRKCKHLNEIKKGVWK